MDQAIAEANLVPDVDPALIEADDEANEAEQYEDDYAESDGDDEQLSNEDGQAAPEEDSEEIELNGQKYRVPKDIKPAVMMHQDYTRKTEDLAAQRRQFEAQAQFHQQHIAEVAKLTAIDEQINQFSQVDWNGLTEQDPIRAQQLFMQFSQLKDGRAQLVNQLAQKEQYMALEQQQHAAKLLQESESVLKREIKNWSPELEGRLQKFAISSFGFDLADVQQAKTDPRIYKLLHLAYQGDQIIKKQTAKARPAEAKPVTNINSRVGKINKDPSEMSDTEFAAWRRKQIAKR